MRWWCSSVSEPWTWQWQAYPGVWLASLALAIPYLMAMRRREGPNPGRGRKTGFWLAGVALFWLASDWPLGLLGSSYLASAHMVQFLIYVLGAAPLLMLGTPEWMARKVLSKLRLYRGVTLLARPLVAGITYNVLLILTHSPLMVDNLRSTQTGSFVMDLIWLLMGLILWLPILSPLPEQSRYSYPSKMLYVFLAGAIVPVIPAAFLTWSTYPLYSTYELAPRVAGISAVDDQQAAGMIMKVAAIPVIWGTLLAMMMRWSNAAEATDRYRQPKTSRNATAPTLDDQLDQKEPG